MVGTVGDGRYGRDGRDGWDSRGIRKVAICTVPIQPM